MSLSALVAGGTGLVGRECLRLLAADEAFSRVVALTRRPLSEVQGVPHGGKIEERIVDFDHLAGALTDLTVDQVFCALGTTIRTAGSRTRFRQVDLGYPLEIASRACEQGADHFLLVSAVGASTGSRFFYNRIKGELEEAVAALPFRRVTIVRPSLLLGDRDEARIGEQVAARLAFLFPPRYRAVHATDVAAALVSAARENRVGQRIIESAAIRGMADGYRSGLPER
jgi:uncharacterized protein YbjT (DUF2867 family)